MKRVIGRYTDRCRGKDYSDKCRHLAKINIKTMAISVGAKNNDERKFGRIVQEKGRKTRS